MKEYKSARTQLVELIEEVDQINVDSHPVLLELISWLPNTTISTFIEDARAALELNTPEECEEETLPPQGEPKYFSSLIPEC